MSAERQYPEPDKTWWGRTRDRIAYHIATFAFTHIATEWYSTMIEGSIRLGLEAARDEMWSRAKVQTGEFDWLNDSLDTEAFTRPTKDTKGGSRG